MTNWTDVLIQVPRYSERPSGLLVPVEVGRPVVSPGGDQLGDSLPISERAFFIMAKPPSALEQMRVVIDEGGVGLPVSGIDELKAMAAELNFERTMLAISRLSAQAWHTRGESNRQLAMVPEVFGDPDLTEKIRLLVRRESERLEIFPEQHAAILQRLLVLYGRNLDLKDPRKPGEQEAFNRAWLAAAVPSYELDRESPIGRVGRQHWIAYLIQNGTYNAVEDSLSAMIRPLILLGDIAGSEEARRHFRFCPIDEWHRELFGFNLAEQFTLGLAVSARARIFDGDAAVGDRSLIPGNYLSDVARRLGRSVGQARNLICGSRAWYRAEFEKREDTVANMAWDRVPFEMRPLWTLLSGDLVAASPRALLSWLGDGFYHRTLVAARERGEAKRFLDFYGWLVEGYVLKMLRAVHPESEPLASCRIFGEQSYGPGSGQRSPDMAVDYGPDLLLFEVYSGRFTMRSVVEGSAEAALDDLARLVFNKAEQLDRRIGEYLDGAWTLPGVDSGQVERIWPVIVTGDLLQNEMLWDEIRDRLSAVFRQPKVQKLTLLDLSEVEQLCGLVERGHGLLDLVARKARGPYAELDFRRYADETPGIANDARLGLLNDRWKEEVDRALGVLKAPA